MNMINGTNATAGIDAGCQYQGAIGKNIEDMLNLSTLSRMLDDFCSVTGLMVDVIDRKSGEVVAAEGTKRICAAFHRDCPASELSCKNFMDTQHAGDAPVSIMCNCELGLSTAFSSVKVGEEILADIFIGPALLAPVNAEQVENTCKAFGIDAGSYLRMMKEVNIVGSEDLNATLAELSETVRILAEGANGQEESALEAYKALFKAKRGFLKDS
ncbi:MAG: PocR ligand-binding domain-containing protein [Nitrospinae bacterium]|nr:PocR ligand-binding domain-containing protein [Nitrospinota bacterium]MBF0634397.1 PocR ligand-binding domain-containing protein [Nitrospinota bacterium]